MRIAVVAPLVAPLLDAQAYGALALLIDLARGLHDRGHDVRVFAAAGSRIPGLAIEQIPTSADVARSAILPADARVRVSPSGGIRRAFEIAFDRVADWSPDAVSGHAFDAEAIELAAVLPLVHTLHLPPIVESVVEAARRSAAAFVAVSEASRRDWAAAGVEARVIRNGVPDLLAGRALGPGTAKRGSGGVAIIAGRISPEKGTATAVRLARAAGLRPLVVGSLYDRAYAEADVLPLLRPGEWQAPVSRRRLAELMAGAAVLIMPVEWDEPFGLVAAEAQVAGCPVAAYRRGALPEIVRDGVTGCLAEPFDEAGLVEAVRAARTLDRPAIRRDALSRLSLGPMLDGYEATLASAGGARIAGGPDDLGLEPRAR